MNPFTLSSSLPVLRIIRVTFPSLLIMVSLSASAQTEEKVDLSGFGGQTGIGFTFGDGLGPVFRYCLGQKAILETGIYYGSTIAPLEENTYNLETGPMIDGAVNFMGNRFEKPNKEKVKANGLVLHAGHLFGDFSTSSASAGWVHESFKKRNPWHSFLFELGLKASFPHWYGTSASGYGTPPAAFPYIRFHWNWYGRKAIGQTAVVASPALAEWPGDAGVSSVPSSSQGVVLRLYKRRQQHSIRGKSFLQVVCLSQETDCQLTEKDNNSKRFDKYFDTIE